METVKINCNGCTLCCQNIGAVLNSKNNSEWVQKLINEFPYKADKNGACEMLKDNKCSVYENRPTICSVDRSFYHQNITNSKIDWLNFNKQACKMEKNKKSKGLEMGEKIIFYLQALMILWVIGKHILKKVS